jgi:hypothetical protein
MELNRLGVKTKTGRGRWQSGNVAGVLESAYAKELIARGGFEQEAAA